MGQRYKVVLELSSNFAGEPDPEVEVKTIRSYLESVAGVGSVTVVTVDPLDPPPGGPSWTPEGPTKTDIKKPRPSKRPKKV